MSQDSIEYTKNNYVFLNKLQIIKNTQFFEKNREDTKKMIEIMKKQNKFFKLIQTGGPESIKDLTTMFEKDPRRFFIIKLFVFS